MTRPPGSILYVDDDGEASRLLPEFLRRCGPVTTARTLAEARAADAPDLLVIDPTLPDGDGLALIQELRARQPWVQVFVICRVASAERMPRFIAAGANDVAFKPFDVGTLVSRATALLADAGAAQQEMTYRRQLEARVSRTARLARLGALSAFITGELHEPLATILASVGSLAETLDRGEPVDAARRLTTAHEVEQVRAAASVIGAFIERLDALARREEELSVDGDLSRVVAASALLLGPRLRARGVCLAIPGGPGPRAPHAPMGLTQALMNVLANAVDAAEPGGAIAIRYVDGPNEVGIAVDDDGPGLGPERQGRALEPPLARCAGLGLLVVREVMGEQGGRFELVPRGSGGRGLTALLALPRPRATRRPTTVLAS